MTSVCIAVAFNENAIQAISSSARDARVLQPRIVRDTSVLAAMASIARGAIPAGNAYRRRQLARMRRAGFEDDVHVAPLSDVTRVVGGRVKSPLSHSLGNAMWKVQFGRAARRALADARPDVVIAMPGSALELFRAKPGAMRVFHAIDSHPRFRNAALTATYGTRRSRAELYPESFVLRVDAELALADVVLVPSRYVAAQMLASGVPEDRIAIQPYGVDFNAFIDAASPDAHDYAQSRPRVLCVSQLSLRKGIPHLVQAADGLDLDVDLVGPVFDRSTVRQLPDNVSVRGAVTRDELIRIYQTADAFVLPTVDDACALVVAEAAASGLPVITTDTNGASELLSARHTTLNHGDVSALRDALREVEQLDPIVRQGIATDAREQNLRSWEDYGSAVVADLMGRLR